MTCASITRNSIAYRRWMCLCCWCWLVFVGWNRQTSIHAFEPRLSPRLVLQPLLGGPAWLRVHVQVSLVDSHQDNNNNKFDFVPLHPTDPSTLWRLMTLRAVPGQIRVFDSTHAPSLLFCQQYKDNQLHLINNNCWTFALQLFFYLQNDRKS